MRRSGRRRATSHERRIGRSETSIDIHAEQGGDFRCGFRREVTAAGEIRDAFYGRIGDQREIGAGLRKPAAVKRERLPLILLTVGCPRSYHTGVCPGVKLGV